MHFLRINRQIAANLQLEQLFLNNADARGRICGLMRLLPGSQSVEQGIENPRVLGSIPSPGTTI